jgi:GNAT superfamily N-acetyltransferase
VTVLIADADDAGRLSQVIADAFHDLPPSPWLIQDPVARRRIFPPYFRLFVEHTLAAGVVQTTPARDAVALWLPSDAVPPDDYGSRLESVTAGWTPRFVTFDEALDKHHPVGVAHHHLAILAVRPDRQGLGIGSALLSAYHAGLGPGEPVYLEASCPRSRELYLRHGYADRGEPYYLPDGPPMCPMWRAGSRPAVQ